MYTCIHIHIYTYTHIHIYTYIYIYIHIIYKFYSKSLCHHDLWKSSWPSQTWHVFDIDDSVPYNSATGRDFEPAAAPSRAGLSMASTGKLVLIQCAVLLNCCETHKHAVFQIVGVVVDMPFHVQVSLYAHAAQSLVWNAVLSRRTLTPMAACDHHSGVIFWSAAFFQGSLHERLNFPFFPAMVSKAAGGPMPIPTRNLGAGSEPLGGSPWKAGTQRQMLEWIPCAGAAEVIWSSKLKVRRHGPVAVDMLAAYCRWVKSKHVQRAPIFLHFLLVHQGAVPLREFHLWMEVRPFIDHHHRLSNIYPSKVGITMHYPLLSHMFQLFPTISHQKIRYFPSDMFQFCYQKELVLSHPNSQAEAMDEILDCGEDDASEEESCFEDPMGPLGLLGWNTLILVIFGDFWWLFTTLGCLFGLIWDETTWFLVIYSWWDIPSTKFTARPWKQTCFLGKVIFQPLAHSLRFLGWKVGIYIVFLYPPLLRSFY